MTATLFTLTLALALFFMLYALLKFHLEARKPRYLAAPVGRNTTVLFRNYGSTIRQMAAGRQEERSDAFGMRV
jgi:hypothetical protein